MELTDYVTLGVLICLVIADIVSYLKQDLNQRGEEQKRLKARRNLFIRTMRRKDLK